TGTPGNDNFAISATEVDTQVGGAPVTIKYSGIQAMEINGNTANQGGNDTFDVTGTSATLGTTLDAGPGNATLNLRAGPTGSASPNPPGLFIGGTGQNAVNVFGSGQTNAAGQDDPIVMVNQPISNNQYVAEVAGEGLDLTYRNPTRGGLDATLNM